MTNKELAEDLRYAVEENYSLDYFLDLADKLDPQGPKPGTVLVRDDGQFGVLASADTVYFYKYSMKWDEFGPHWKPARILSDDEVAVKIPPVSEWPSGATEIAWRWVVMGKETGSTIITRAEAEEREG